MAARDRTDQTLSWTYEVNLWKDRSLLAHALVRALAAGALVLALTSLQTLNDLGRAVHVKPDAFGDVAKGAAVFTGLAVLATLVAWALFAHAHHGLLAYRFTADDDRLTRVRAADGATCSVTLGKGLRVRCCRRRNRVVVSARGCRLSIRAEGDDFDRLVAHLERCTQRLEGERT